MPTVDARASIVVVGAPKAGGTRAPTVNLTCDYARS